MIYHIFVTVIKIGIILQIIGLLIYSLKIHSVKDFFIRLIVWWMVILFVTLILFVVISI